MTTHAHAIEADGLTKFYGTFEAVRGLTMRVPKGSINGFLGQNGAGSTRRRTNVLLSPLGADAIRDTLVLETEKLEAILSGLTTREMKSVATGMATLGNACRRHAEGAKRRATAK